MSALCPRCETRPRHEKRGYCRECERVIDAARKRTARRNETPYAQRQRQQKRTSTYKARRNALRRTADAREKQRVYTNDYRSRNPDARAKTRARAALNNAVAAGKIKRPETCELCDQIPPLGADGRTLLRADHYKGYSQKHYLTVRWICATCDGEVEMRRGNTSRAQWKTKEGL